MPKLIIWDLDATLRKGTLEEGNEVTLFEGQVAAIKTLNEQGVVHSICSKNDFDFAKAGLEELGLFEEFVFPEINFAAKGPIGAAHYYRPESARTRRRVRRR